MSKPIVVAEIGINHNGKLSLAKANIALAHSLGADYVKFQKRTIDAVYTEEYLGQKRVSPWGNTNRQQKEGLEFGRTEYDEIDAYCKQIGMKWFCTVTDPAGLDFVLKYSPEFLKVASFDLTNMDILVKMREHDIPVIVSTGMSTKKQIDAALGVLGHHAQYLLHCVSSYPTPVEEMNMRRLSTLQEIYGKRYRVGFSNHSERIIYTMQAAIMGAEMLEFHVTIDRNLYGSDQQASIGPTGFDRIMSHLDSVDVGWGDGGIGPRPSEAPVAKKLRRFP